MHKAAPTTENYLVQNVSCAKIKKPWFRARSSHPKTHEAPLKIKNSLTGSLGPSNNSWGDYATFFSLTPCQSWQIKRDWLNNKTGLFHTKWDDESCVNRNYVKTMDLTMLWRRGLWLHFNPEEMELQEPWSQSTRRKQESQRGPWHCPTFFKLWAASICVL